MRAARAPLLPLGAAGRAGSGRPRVGGGRGRRRPHPCPGVGGVVGASQRPRLRHLASSPLPRLRPSQAKASCAVQGELNCCNSMGALEMHQRLEQLKRRIHRVHLYSQGEPTARCAGPPDSHLPAGPQRAFHAGLVSQDPWRPAHCLGGRQIRVHMGTGEGGAGRWPRSLRHREGN